MCNFAVVTRKAPHRSADREDRRLILYSVLPSFKARLSWLNRVVTGSVDGSIPLFRTRFFGIWQATKIV